MRTQLTGLEFKAQLEALDLQLRQFNSKQLSRVQTLARKAKSSEQDLTEKEMSEFKNIFLRFWRDRIKLFALRNMMNNPELESTEKIELEEQHLTKWYVGNFLKRDADLYIDKWSRMPNPPLSAGETAWLNLCDKVINGELPFEQVKKTILSIKKL